MKGTEREAEAALTVVCLEEMDGRTRGITVKLCADEAQAQRELDRMVLIATKTNTNATHVRRGDTWAEAQVHGDTGKILTTYRISVEKATASKA